MYLAAAAYLEEMVAEHWVAYEHLEGRIHYKNSSSLAIVYLDSLQRTRLEAVVAVIAFLNIPKVNIKEQILK